jgi:tetratricopeptide (TPR) repeat protein
MMRCILRTACCTTAPLAVLTALAAPAPLAAQFPPDSLSNLQVLPEDIAFGELMDYMRGFTRALGVRCSHCHVGEENQPLSAYDFATDDKALKRKARIMLRMVQTINGEQLAELDDRNEPPVRVQCFTCHRGTRVPRTLQEELRIAYDDGIDALLSRYHELRQRYYGRATYDFSSVALADVGTELEQAGSLSEAETVHSLNVEMNPGDWFAQWQHAAVALPLAFRLGLDSGVARFRQLREEYQPQAFSERAVNQLGYSLLERDAAAAVAVFRLNVEEHPDSWNAHDSLAEGLEAIDDRKAAIQHYRRSLELNPENQHARERIAALGG